MDTFINATKPSRVSSMAITGQDGIIVASEGKEGTAKHTIAMIKLVRSLSPLPPASDWSHHLKAGWKALTGEIGKPSPLATAKD
jgi:hypothetical protein